MIRGYGLQAVEGGISAAVLFGLMQRQGRMDAAASARDLVRSHGGALTSAAHRRRRSTSWALGLQGQPKPSVANFWS